MKDSSQEYPKFDIKPRGGGNFFLIVSLNSVLHHHFEMCTKDVMELGDKFDFLRENYISHITRSEEK